MDFIFRYSSLFFFSGLLLICCSTTAAQNTSGVRRSTADSSAAIEERLVELALKGPMFQGSVHENKITEYQLRGAKNSWLNLLTISTTYNDQTFSKTAAQNNIIYPKYFVGLTVPLGTLFSRTQVNAAREAVEVSKNSQEQLKRDIRASVVSEYKQYKAYGELIAMQSELLNDVQAALLQSEEKFRKGTITIDTYNTAQRNNNDERAKLINLQLQQDLIKVEIEKMIGTRLENVLK